MDFLEDLSPHGACSVDTGVVSEGGQEPTATASHERATRMLRFKTLKYVAVQAIVFLTWTRG